jgi:hypothetical protein
MKCAELRTRLADPRYTRVMQPDFDEVARVTDPKRQQLERRSEERRQKVLRKYPDTGAFLLAMSDEPNAETAFQHGAPWQRWVAELLREEFPTGVFLFNRRRGPDHAGDIDVVAVVPSGVWVIDVVRYEGAKVDVRSGKSPERGQYLSVDGADASAALDDLDDQAAAVTGALARAGWEQIATQSVLCLVDVDASWRGHARVGTTHVSKARPMLRLLAAGPASLDDTDIASLGLSLDKSLARQRPAL